MTQLTDRYGTLVFSDAVRKQYLPSDIYKKLAKTIQEGKPLDLEVANAVAHGMTLVTATLENGREACCIVAVDCNATVMNSDIIIRKSPSASGEKLGTLVRGLPIKVISDKILYDAAGSPFYSVRGISSDGKLTEGYATA